MKRLRDMRDDDPALREAQALLAAVDPLPASNAHMRRVGTALEQKAAARTGKPRRGVVVLAFVLVFSGTALAAAQGLGVLREVIARVIEPAQPTPTPPVAQRTARKRVTQPAAQGASAAPVIDARGSAREQNLELPAPAERASVDAARVGSDSAPLAAPAVSLAPRPRRSLPGQPGAADNELVRRAVIALRRDHDAERAARLLEEVHARSPHGPLAEEVMSLRVEAALARADRRARGYAQEYLATYPQGRYRALSLRALTGAPPP